MAANVIDFTNYVLRPVIEWFGKEKTEQLADKVGETAFDALKNSAKPILQLVCGLVIAKGTYEIIMIHTQDYRTHCPNKNESSCDVLNSISIIFTLFLAAVTAITAFLFGRWVCKDTNNQKFKAIDEKFQGIDKEFEGIKKQNEETQQNFSIILTKLDSIITREPKVQIPTTGSNTCNDGQRA